MAQIPWFITVVVGPALLIGAILFLTLRNRGASRKSEREAEQGAKDLRRDIENDPEYRDD